VPCKERTLEKKILPSPACTPAQEAKKKRSLKAPDGKYQEKEKPASEKHPKRTILTST